jgi:hypothetical protein
VQADEGEQGECERCVLKVFHRPTPVAGVPRDSIDASFSINE